MTDVAADRIPNLSLRARLVRLVTAWYFDSLDVADIDVRAVRRRWGRLSKLLIPAIGVRVRRDHVAGLRAEWLVPKLAPERKLILYLHGGAYVMGGCDTHRQLVSHIARASGVRALLPDYRLAPEHPYPAAIEDAVAVYRRLLADGYAARDIVLAGDSAGGGLAVALLLSLKAAGDPLPAAACLLSPWLDLAAAGDSMSSRADRDPWFRAEDLPHVAAYYCAEKDLVDPLVSPVYADVSGLPPFYVQVGADEILFSDTVRFGDNIRAAGGTIEIEEWPNMWHVFQAFVAVMPESRRAINKLADYIRDVLCL